MTWSSSNTTGTVTVQRLYDGNSVFATGSGGPYTWAAFWPPSGSSPGTFTLGLYDGSNQIATADYTATCASGTAWVGGVCTPVTFSCSSLPSNATGYPAPDNTPAANTAYSYSATDTAAKCEFSCNSGYSWNGSSCTPTGSLCTSLPSNATGYPAPDNAPTSSTAYTYSATDTATKCQFNCNTGYVYTPGNNSCVPQVWTTYCTGSNDPNGNNWQVWKHDNSTPTQYQFVENGSTANGCTPSTFSCTGTPPSNSTAYPAPDNTGLSANTAYTYSDTDTAAKCQFACNGGYSWNGSACVAASYACTDLPANATGYPAPDNTGLSANTAYTYSDTDTAAKCEFSCTAGNHPYNGASGLVCLPDGPGCIGESQGRVCCYDSVTQQYYYAVSCTQPRIDLSAGAITPTTATAGIATTYSAQILNLRDATGAGFYNSFQKSTDADHFFWSDIGTFITSPALPAQSSGTISKSYTFSSAGTYYMRMCADKSTWASTGDISEIDENNNCGAWTPITVSANSSPSTSLSCSRSPSGSSLTGPATVTFTATPSGGVSAPYTFYDALGNVLQPAGPSTTYTHTYGSGSSYAVTVAATGISGTAACGTAFSVSSACGILNTNITANPARVQSGGSTSIAWTATAVQAACTLTENGAPIQAIAANSCAIPGGGDTVNRSNITKQSTYCIKCDNNDDLKKCVTVNILPIFQEF